MRLAHHDAPDAKVFCRGHEIPAQREAHEYVAIVAEAYASPREPFTCELKNGATTLDTAEFEVHDKTYPNERLTVPARLVKLSAADQTRYDSEQDTLRPVYARSSPTLLFQEPFTAPLNSRITSAYGTRRVLNGEANSEHNGVDFRAAIGAKVPVANAGRVAFVGHLMRSGNLVVVDHGLGIFTQYHHLAKILVAEGDAVRKGQVIGLAGNTGRASGPHLHWAVRVHGEFVDGFSLIRATELLTAAPANRRVTNSGLPR